MSMYDEEGNLINPDFSAELKRQKSSPDSGIVSLTKDTGGGFEGKWVFPAGSNKPEGGWTGRTSGQINVPYEVTIPWPFSFILGSTLKFRTQDDAIAFRDQIVSLATFMEEEGFPLAVGGLFAALTYLTYKHPAEMQGVLEAMGKSLGGALSGIGEIAKGIGEVVPG